eukprot:1158164-Pelagomonas_calceolata.AAC.4
MRASATWSASQCSGHSGCTRVKSNALIGYHPCCTLLQCTRYANQNEWSKGHDRNAGSVCMWSSIPSSNMLNGGQVHIFFYRPQKKGAQHCRAGYVRSLRYDNSQTRSQFWWTVMTLSPTMLLCT